MVAEHDEAKVAESDGDEARVAEDELYSHREFIPAIAAGALPGQFNVMKKEISSYPECP